jgi:hypothetical protein
VDEEEHSTIMKWNTKEMKAILPSLSKQSWFETTLDAPEYMIWLPPYWKSKEIDVYANFFLEPTAEM